MELLFFFLGLIIVISIIVAFFRACGNAKRIVFETRKVTAATEAQTQMFYDAMTPEAKLRVVEAKQARIAGARRARLDLWASAGVAALVFAIGFSLVMLAPTPAPAQELQQAYGWGRGPYAPMPHVFYGPWSAYAYVPNPPVPLPPPPIVEPPPFPIGWVHYRLAPCADPSCGILRIAVNADGANVRAGPGGPVLGSLANGVPVVPLQRVGEWIEVGAACPLVPTWTFSVTAGVPLSVCL